MQAVVWHGVGDIRLDDVGEPTLQEPEDAIVRLTSSAICGTDLHFVRGTMAGMKPGTILGHEGVGVVEALGENVRNFERGERVVICSTIACGSCSYCRAGYYAQCDRANPNGPQAGRYVPRLVELVRSGVVDPQTVVTQLEDVSGAIEAYEAFDDRRPGWLKVELEPVA